MVWMLSFYENSSPAWLPAVFGLQGTCTSARQDLLPWNVAAICGFLQCTDETYESQLVNAVGEGQSTDTGQETGGLDSCGHSLLTK